jgi:zinc protease
MAGILVSSLWLNSQNLKLGDKLPLDENVHIGKLENGLTYYIKQNQEPKNFAELRLVVNAGSVLENDDQQGLAHFTEHLAFNGTESFPGNKLNEYLSSIGLGYMGGLNAMTSFDMTVYLLTSKTDDKTQIDTAFLILSDWAARLTFDHEKIDKERGIILEEWRGGRGANERILNQQKSVIFGDSKYAERMPIGNPDTIQNFDYQLIKDFYNDWYRPDLQAVIAVGDFEIAEIKDLINKHFNSIPPKENPRPKPEYPIPSHSETKFAFATDKEATQTTVSIMYKHPATLIETIADYREQTILALLNIMLNNRFAEISRRENSPFSYAGAGKGSLTNTMDMYSLYAIVDENHIIDGYTAIITEIERAKRHGFYNSELIRAKDMLFKNIERSFQEKDKTSSNRLIWTLVNHFLKSTPLLNIDYEYTLVNDLLSTIEMNDILQSLAANITEENKIISLTGPENLNVELPSEKEVISLFATIQNSQIDVYPESELSESLINRTIQTIQVKKPSYDKKLDVYTWSLPNGASVHLKQTNFRNNEILFSAFRKGGLSQADDAIFKSARMSSHIMNEAGMGLLDKNLLDNFLSRRDLQYNTSLTPKNESLYARSSVKDIETLFELIWLNFNQPRFDDIAFDTWKRRMEISLKNMQNSPNYIFNEEINNLLYNNHLRVQQLNVNDLLQLDHQTAFDFYKSRFTSANSFNFIFVGNISKDDLHTYIERYLASLPKTKVNTSIINRHIKFNQTAGSKTINKGEDEKTLVRLIYTNSYRYNFKENLKIRALNFILSEMLLENIREKISGVYVIYSQAVIENDPIQQIAIHIDFGCSPDRVEEITNEITNQINQLIKGTFDSKHLANYKETANKRLEINLKTNKHWLDQIESKLFHKFSSSDILNNDKLINQLTTKDITSTAKKYIDPKKRLQIVLYPLIYVK